VSSSGRQWRLVHGGPEAWWSTTHGPSSWNSQFKNKSKIQLFWEFCYKAPRFFEINPRSRFCTQTPWIFEINSKFSPSHFQKLQIGPYNFFSPYLCNRNSKFSDSFTRILGITSSFFLCIHITHVCFILLIDCLCCFVIGDAVSGPFFENLQDQAFEESQLFFADQEGKFP
jgi:hypothetical protein